jgi:iron complex outermembrane receptor protein
VFGSTTVSRREGEFAYRMSAGYTREPRWSREVAPGRVDTQTFASDQDLGSTNARFALQVARRLGKDAELTVGGGASKVYRNLQAFGSIFEYDLQGWVGDVEASLVTKNVNVRAFYSRLDVRSGKTREYSSTSIDRTRPQQNVFDVQAEYTDLFQIGNSHSQEVHLGATYRLKEVNWDYIDRERKENWVGFFGQDTLKFGKSFQAVASLRADYVPYLKQLVPSPRGSLIYKPTERSAVRLSGSTAFRSPTLVEAYLDLMVRSAAAPGAGLISNTSRPDEGSDFRLKREHVVSIDLGYLNQDFDSVNFEVTGYYLQVKDLITLAESRGETLSSNRINGLDPETGVFAAGFSGFQNQCLVYNTFGGEAGAKVFPAEGLDLFVNYSLNQQKVTRPDGCTDVENKQTSVHKINAGVQGRSTIGFDGEITMHYASSQLWAERVPPPATETSAEVRWETRGLDGYFLVNARLGYRFLSNAAEVSGTVYNLLNQRHQEHPFGQVVGRRFMSFLSYRF